MAANRFEGFFQDWANMMRVFAAVLFGLLLFGLDPAWAEVECFPHCDYWHDYGPYDFTYKQPGLFGYPICGPRGDCLPYLTYMYQRLSLRPPGSRAID